MSACRYLVVAAATAACLLAEKTANSAAELAADHRVLSTIELGDGSTRSRIEFTFTNTGDVAFDDLFVEWIHAVPFSFFGPPAPIWIGPLAPSETATLEVALDFIGPLTDGVPVLLIGHGNDGDLMVPVDALNTEPSR